MAIDTKKLRQLAQAATPGPWVAKNVSGAGLEIHMIHPVYPDKEWPAFGTDSAFCKKGLVSYETWTQFPHEVRDVQQSKNAEFIAAANPATVSELLDRIETAEKERDALRAELDALKAAFKCVHESHEVMYQAANACPVPPAPSVPEGWLKRGIAELEAIRDESELCGECRSRANERAGRGDKILIERLFRAFCGVAPEIN